MNNKTSLATNVSARFKKDVQNNKMKSTLLCRAAFCIELSSLSVGNLQQSQRWEYINFHKHTLKPLTNNRLTSLSRHAGVDYFPAKTIKSATCSRVPH